MKVQCINNGELKGAMDSKVNLTLGKTYEVIEHEGGDDFYRVVNDLGKKIYYHSGRFRPIDLVREKKLKQLGI